MRGEPSLRRLDAHSTPPSCGTVHKRGGRRASLSGRPSSCPSWARTRTLLIPYHFGFRRRSAARAFVVWTVPSPSPRRGQVAPTQSLHLPLTGLGSALPVKGPPTSRAFTHVVSDMVSSECTLRCGQSQACCQLHQGAASYHSKAGTARLQLTRREEVTPQPRYISSLPLLNPPALCTIQRAACGARRHSTCNPARGSRSAVSGQRPEPPAGPSTLELRAAR